MARLQDKRLDVKLSPEGGTCVPGLVVTPVGSMGDVAAVLRTGERNRSVGRTNMNEHSRWVDRARARAWWHSVRV